MSFSDTKLSMLLFIILIAFFAVGLPITSSHAQNAGIIWNPPINISNSEDNVSTDPFLLADPAGVAHLFWAEQVANMTGNQPDTLMYTAWDGNNWSQPEDIFIPPLSHLSPQVHYPTAAIDNQGFIHLIWLMAPNPPSYSLYYSRAPASQASSAGAWLAPVVLADNLTGIQYPIDIQIDSDQTLHVIYARGPQGDLPSEQRSVSYLRSTDGGITWSTPVNLFTVSVIDNGVSNTRLLAETPNKVYAVWTEWGPDGNGQAIYFDRSLDDGQNWEQPVLLTKRIGNEYERDWPNLDLLGENQMVVFWEGGYRAYRQAMYSYDGGVTWSQPIDTFPWLIGENGSVEFARDGNGTPHLFVAQRIREGSNRNYVGSLWHSVWEGGTRWSDPQAMESIPMVNPKVVIICGNQVIASWYSNIDLEVRAKTGFLVGVPSTEPLIWQNVSKTSGQKPPPMLTPTTSNKDQNLSREKFSLDSSTLNKTEDNPIKTILLSVLPSLAIIGLAFFTIYHKKPDK